MPGSALIRGEGMDYPRVNDAVRLSEYVTHELIRDMQEAMTVVHRAGRLDLAESLRAWAERLAEALAMDNEPPEAWLG
jgi:hypothetical protein